MDVEKQNQKSSEELFKKNTGMSLQSALKKYGKKHDESFDDFDKAFGSGSKTRKKGRGPMPPESDLNKMEYGSYKENLEIPGYEVLAKSPTIVFYKRIADNTVIIAVRGSADSRDWLGTNTLLPFNALTWSARYKEDKKFVADNLPKYSQGNDVYVVGHSLGGAIADQLQKDFPIIKGGLSFNPAYQPLDFLKKSKVERKYNSRDPLGLLGRFLPGAKVENNEGFLQSLLPTTLLGRKDAHMLTAFESGKDNKKDQGQLKKTAKTSFNPLGWLSRKKTVYEGGGDSKLKLLRATTKSDKDKYMKEVLFKQKIKDYEEIFDIKFKPSEIKILSDAIKEAKKYIDEYIIEDSKGNEMDYDALEKTIIMDFINRVKYWELYNPLEEKKEKLQKEYDSEWSKGMNDRDIPKLNDLHRQIRDLEKLIAKYHNRKDWLQKEELIDKKYPVKYEGWSLPYDIFKLLKDSSLQISDYYNYSNRPKRPVGTGKKVCMDKKVYVKEHKKLIKILEKAGEEGKAQKKELKDELKGGWIQKNDNILTDMSNEDIEQIADDDYEYQYMIKRRNKLRRLIDPDVDSDIKDKGIHFGGIDTNGYELHAVIVKKKGYNKKDAEKEALKITHKKTIFSRDTQLTYRFRNIPKTKFEPKSFRTKIINPNISLVFGKLK